MSAGQRTLGILLGIVLGLAIVVAFVFLGSQETIDDPSLSGGEQAIERQAVPAPEDVSGTRPD